MRTIWSSKKRRVVLPKTTACFTQNDVLFCIKRRVVFLRRSLPLSHRWEKTRKGAATRRKNTVLFYLFCKTHLSKFGHKPQKTVYFTPKMEQKTAFFSFFFDFSHQHRKKQENNFANHRILLTFGVKIHNRHTPGSRTSGSVAVFSYNPCLSQHNTIIYSLCHS